MSLYRQTGMPSISRTWSFLHIGSKHGYRFRSVDVGNPAFIVIALCDFCYPTSRVWKLVQSRYGEMYKIDIRIKMAGFDPFKGVIRFPVFHPVIVASCVSVEEETYPFPSRTETSLRDRCFILSCHCCIDSGSPGGPSILICRSSPSFPSTVP
jgi:hypothetical protein